MVSQKMFAYNFRLMWPVFLVGAVVAVVYRYSQTKDKDRKDMPGYQYLF